MNIRGIGLIYLQRVASEIKNIGLYDLVLQDVQRLAGKNKLTEDEILEIMKDTPQILEDYKQINVEYNLSNIHIRDIAVEKLEGSCKQKAELVNKNLKTLKELEPYTLDFEQSSVLVIIFSVEFFVLFSVQYFIVLLDLKEWQMLIYTLFATSIALAWMYAKKEQKKFKVNSESFYKLYDETLCLISELEEKNCIKKEELIIKECEEHV